MSTAHLVEMIAFPGWIIGVCRLPEGDYSCWVMTPELTLISDGETYTSGDEALSAGRFLVEYSIEVD
ncbi:MAG: hypothetical protein HC851_01750 [Acaryochloris sp. RU_4_1]|nr:hypothetical protein [Acaryochloris sp. RU_4_1]NJR53361.1 hypothetical protein [Acaryochloris sp. CRU_2_0]